jgi:predicted MFS family arabinose efflux permease
MLPPDRRAEGIGYWGLSTTFATAFAPSLGLWLSARVVALAVPLDRHPQRRDG